MQFLQTRFTLLGRIIILAVSELACVGHAFAQEEDARRFARTGYEEQSKEHFQIAMEAFYEALTSGGLMAEEQPNVRLALSDCALASGQPEVVIDALSPYAAKADVSGDADDAVDSRLRQARSELQYQHLDRAYAALREQDGEAAVEQFRLGFSCAAGDAVYDQSGSDSVQGLVGVRYKPFTNYNVVFGLERLLAVGELARTEWLARAGFSLGEGGDLNAAANDWSYWNVYVEAARYVQSRQSVPILETRYGHSWKTGSGSWVLTPYWAISADRDTLAMDRHPWVRGPR